MSRAANALSRFPLSGEDSPFQRGGLLLPTIVATHNSANMRICVKHTNKDDIGPLDSDNVEAILDTLPTANVWSKKHRDPNVGPQHSE